jgi:hypothetical protein
MTPIKLILLVFALVLEAIATLPRVEPYRLQIIAAGLAFWLASIILPL